MIIKSLLLFMMLSPPEIDFDQYYTGNTFRFDYFHSGIATEEHISLDVIRLEGDWPGSRTRLIDDSGLGKYLFEVFDLSSGQLIYSRGFASIYGEWETTREAMDGIWKSIHESQRFPEPRNPVRIVLKKRDNDNAFHEIYSAEVDPGSRFIDRSPMKAGGEVWRVFNNGVPDQKVDILVLGDGYARAELDKYRRDTERLISVLFDTEPFKSRKSDFNVWGIDVASDESGISNPRKGIWKNSALGLSFNAFDSDRYVLTFKNKDIREIAARAPYDVLIILANSNKYGGGGIYNLYATATVDTEPSEYLIVHEFGHSFAALADEYYTSSTSYEEYIPEGVEPWEVNVTALLDPKNLKWKDLVDGDTPIPTPWNQDAYDEIANAFQEQRRKLIEQGASEEDMNQYFREVKKVTAPMLAGEKYADRVGAFEGAAYQAKGLFRPEIDCIMFSRNVDYYCRVCAKGIETVIDLYTR